MEMRMMKYDRDSRPVKSASNKGHRHLGFVVCALALLAACGCRLHGEKITFTVEEMRILPVSEFRTLFDETNLNSKCYWYFGNKDGYACVEIDESRAIDEYDDILNRRQHHTLRRYRVAEVDVEFIPRIGFVGWDGYGGKRITEIRKDVPDGMAVYRIKNPIFKH
jgi:hypothetical protein